MAAGLQKTRLATVGIFNDIGKTIDNTMGKVDKLKKPTKVSIDTRDVQKAANDISKTTTAVKGLGNTPAKIKVDTTGVDKANKGVKDLKDGLNDIDRKGNGGFSFGKMFSANVLADYARQGVSSIIGAGKYTIQQGMEGSANKVAFETMAGTAPGGQLYNDITKFAQESIFGNELYGNAKQMLAYGIAAKDIMPNLKMLGDVSMGNKEHLNSLTLAFSQTTAAGKLMGQDLLQYIAAGFNPLQTIAEKTGKKYADLRSAMEDGKISADMVRQAFVIATSEGGRFYKMTENVSKTAFGKWDIFKGNVQGVALNAGTKILPAVSAYIDSFTQSLDKMAPVIDAAVTAFQDVTPSVLTFGAKAGAALAPVIDVLTSKQFVDGIKGILDLSSTVIGDLKPALSELGKGIKEVSGLVGVLASSINDVMNAKGASLLSGTRIRDYAFELLMTAKKDVTYEKGISDPGKMAKAASNVIPDYALHPKNPNWEQDAIGGKKGNKNPNPSLDLSGIESSTDKITGGGRRQVIINNNKPIFDHLTYHVNGMGESRDDLESKFTNWLMRLYNSVNAG